MFSTSMIASSTTSPSAIARPPSVIVFRMTPNDTSTMIATSGDNGIAAAESRMISCVPSASCVTESGSANCGRSAADT